MSEKSGKRIVICCDGTGNEFGENNSNVVKLYTCLTINNDQVGYYHPGVGTMGSPQARGKWAKKWSVIRGLAFGDGFMENVEDAYRYLMEVYDDGDEVYLFGFSRGSYTARALAAILHAYGLLCRGNEGHIPYMLQLFNDDMQAAHESNRKRKAGEKKTMLSVREPFKETFSHPGMYITFVGLWDTVSSVGWITEPVRLLYSAQNPSIACGRHAISIDERRCFYRDNLWGPSLDATQTTFGREQDLLQVWFAGAHSDVGGSYPLKESGLSLIAFQWLLAEAEAAGILVKEDRKKMVLGEPTEDRHAAAGLYAPTPEQPGPMHNELKLPRGLGWWLLEVIPMRSYDNDQGTVNWILPLGRARTLPDQSLVHGSVLKRMRDTTCGYEPENLAKAELEGQPVGAIDPETGVAPCYRYSSPRALQSKQTDPAKVVMAGVAALIGTVIATSMFRRL